MGDKGAQECGEGLGTRAGARTPALPSARSPENKLSSSQAQDLTLEERAMPGWPAQNVGRVTSSLVGAPSLFTLTLAKPLSCEKSRSGSRLSKLGNMPGVAPGGSLQGMGPCVNTKCHMCTPPTGRAVLDAGGSLMLLFPQLPTKARGSPQPG